MQDRRVPAVKAEDLVGVLYHCVPGEVMDLQVSSSKRETAIMNSTSV